METPAHTPVITLKALRWSLALLLAAALLAGGALATALHFDQQVERELRQAKSALAETRARLGRAHDDEREIRERIARYQEIIARGRTQPERRLEWVETLRNIRDERRLLGLDYEIAPQRPLDEKNPASGGFNFLVSPMRLEMPLLHENDLLGLLADLRSQVDALLKVNQCRIERVASPVTGSGAVLKATCDIEWFTLQEKS